jgi:hypothetical protein
MQEIWLHMLSVFLYFLTETLCCVRAEVNSFTLLHWVEGTRGSVTDHGLPSKSTPHYYYKAISNVFD